MNSTPSILINAKNLSPSAHLIECSKQPHTAPSSQAYSTSPDREQHHRPAFQRQTSLPPSPQTIIISAWPTAWPSACSSQLLRYIYGYRALYPEASILLLTHPRTIFSSAASEHLHSAVQALPRPAPSSEGTVASASTILLHVFGTSAAARACALLRLYRSQYGTCAPVKALVLDTAPSSSLALRDLTRLRGTGWKNGLAWMTGVVSMILWMLAGWLVGGNRAEDERVRRELSGGEGKEGIVPVGVKRAYMFPGREMLFSWKEGGGRRGRGIGEKGEAWEEDVRRQWAVNQEKVGRERWSGDEERFWEGVEALWEGRGD